MTLNHSWEEVMKHVVCWLLMSPLARFSKRVLTALPFLALVLAASIPGARTAEDIPQIQAPRGQDFQTQRPFGAAQMRRDAGFPGPMPRDGGPRNHRILLASSKDGLNWTVANESLAEQASVPELLEGPDGRLIVLFVDASGQLQRGTLGAMVRADNGRWLRTGTNLRGADPNVVRLTDATYRAYTKERNGAIIVFSSRDGLQWERLGVAFQDECYRNSTDADVFETPSAWVMLISLRPRMLRCTSSNGRRFTTDGSILDLGGSVSDTVKAEGGWRTYFHINATPRIGGRMLIRSAFTADGQSWKIEESDRVVAPSSGPAQLGVADPAPVRLKDGSWLMMVKSFIEPDGAAQFTPNAGDPPERSGFEPQPLPRQANPGGPWDRDVIAYRVSANGGAEKMATFERAGVPTVARFKDGRLLAAHQHFPENDRENFDKVAVRFSSDEGRTWGGLQVIQVTGLPEKMRFPFDPTLVPLPDGRVRLYFTGNMGRTFGPSTPAIHSAISSEGVNYVYEPGVRFGIEGRIVIDCAVALHDDVFHLIAPDNGAAEDFMARPQRGQQTAGGNGYRAISKDGLKFERIADVELSSARDRWLGNMQSDGGKLVFFGTGPGPWPVTSKAGVIWETAAASMRVPGADPGTVKLRDGSWLLVVTGEPRPGTPSAFQRGNVRGQPPGEKPVPRDNPRLLNDEGAAPPPPDVPGRRPGFGNPPPQSGGLESHQIQSATSADGLHWTRDEGVRVASASVPCAINDGDRRVLLYFVKPSNQPRQPEKVACAVSTDGLKFDPAAAFRIEGLSTLKAVDPSILKDTDGKFRLYYLALNQRGDPARAPNPQVIHLALSDDGFHFREVGPAFTYDELVDPDVFRFKDRWFMYVFAGGDTVISTAVDGRKFSYLRDLTPRDWGTTAPVPLSGGRLRPYAFEQRVPIGNVLRSFLSTNGFDWIAEPGERLKARADEQKHRPRPIPATKLGTIPCWAITKLSGETGNRI